MRGGKVFKWKDGGFMVSRDGKLGGSPDGFVPQTKTLVEVKCPYSKRNVFDIDAMMDTDNKWWLMRSPTNPDALCFNMRVQQP